MPLKIRCPNCHKLLVAEHETAGEQRLCPACQVPFTVPIPLSPPPASPAPDVAVRCPGCGADVAPGTPVCPRCHTDVKTGARLPLARRLRLVSIRVWAAAALVALGLALCTYVGVHVYWARFRPPTVNAPGFEPAPHTPFAAGEWAQRLLAAATPAERISARDKLLHGGSRAAAQVAQAVAAALGQSLRGGSSNVSAARNQRAALLVLARAAADDPHALERYGELLESCGKVDALRETAGCTRALLGDLRVFGEMRQVWLRTLRRWVFFNRLIDLAHRQQDVAAARLLVQTGAEAALAGDGLRRLQQAHEADVLDDLVNAYWESWSWLGQSRGARVATELFALAKPVAPAEPGATQGEFEQEKAAIRGARDALSRVGQRAAPLARAAAGLILAHAAPQYRAARERIAGTLPAALPDSPPDTQQQLTWALARLTGRQFGTASERSWPTEIGREDVAAALRWARDAGLAEPASLTTPADGYPRPPSLSYRVVSPVRQLERDLLREFQQGWPQANRALDQWTEADLGCTPAVLALLDPGQRQPNYPALAAAIVLAADGDQPDVRQVLVLWGQATDQPAWVRQLAYTALAALDARAGRWDGGWPVGLDLGPPAKLDAGEPGWRHWGYLLASGGTAMRERLVSARLPQLPAPMMTKLLASAEEAGRRRGYDTRP